MHAYHIVGKVSKVAYIPSYTYVYALNFAGLSFNGVQILAIFVFLFLRMQGLSL